jgi:hypothetical protein
VLAGDPARALAEHVERVAQGGASFDLIVTGTHQRTPLERLAFGSVATKLLRAGYCSMLVTPEAARTPIFTPRSVEAQRPGAPPAPGWQAMSSEEPGVAWSRRMKQFSERNASRVVELEVDDREMGAQHAARGYELRGVTFDHRDGRAQIMLGDLTLADRHLTHSVSGVTAIDILTDENGRDRALRIAHEAGQSLLTFAG